MMAAVRYLRRITPASSAIAIVGLVWLAGCRGGVADPAHLASAPAPAATAVSATQVSASPAGLVVVHDPGHVTGSITGSCHYRDGGKLPDPRCTPGAIDPAVTQANIHRTICVSGYTAKVRPSAKQTDRFKYKVAYPAYGTPKRKKTELDHLVSLELGGSNDAANLWPESPPTPNPKDKVENALHRAVCEGRVSLTAAQRAIASDWLTAEASLGLK